MRYSLLPSVFMFFLVSLSTCVLADNTPSYILDEHSKPADIGVNTRFLVDTQGVLSIDDVINAGGWSQVSRGGLTAGFTNDIYWLSFSVENQSNNPMHWKLEFGYPLLDSIEFYSPLEGGGFAKKLAGDHMPFSHRDIEYRNVVFSLSTQKRHKQTYYVRIKTVSSMNVPLKIWPQDTFYAEVDLVKMFLGAIFGALMLALGSSLVTAFILRDTMNLWLVGAFLSLSLYLNGIKGLTFQYYWPESIWWQTVHIPVFINLGFVCVMQFCRVFTDLKSIAPRLNVFFSWLICCDFLAACLSLFVNYELMIRVSTIAAIGHAVLALYVGVMAWVKGNRSARFYIVGWAAFAFGMIVFALRTLGLIPSNEISLWSQEIGFIGVVFFMTISQFDRFLQTQLKYQDDQTSALIALTHAERKYRSLYENAIEGIFQLDGDGFVENVNKAFVNIAGNQYTGPGDGHSRIPFNLGFLGKEEAYNLEQALAKVDNVAGYEIVFLDENNEQRYVSVSVQKVDDDNHCIYEGAIADITETKKREEAEKKRRMAEASTEAKSMFLANMSHEIRTPMNAIIGFTDLAIGSYNNQNIADYLRKIKVAAKNLLGIINDILDFSKMEAGKLSINCHPFSISEMLENIKDIEMSDLESKGLMWELELDSKLPDVIVGDELRISQILVNLISNAIKFTEKGSINVTLDLVSLEAESITLKGKVIDSGIGIAKEKQKYLFSSFTQADESTTRMFGGTGLGLSISKQLVEMMGGEIQVHSEEGKGSCFEFTVVCQTYVDSESVESLGITQAQPINFKKEDYDFNGLSVLLVEDVTLNQELAKEILVKQGMIVSIASDGKEGVDKARNGEFQLILMDMQMPIMDGCDATKEIRTFDTDVPIIAMTANALESDRRRCFSSGMNGFIVKPIDDVEMFSTIVNCVSNVRKVYRDHLLDKNKEMSSDAEKLEGSNVLYSGTLESIDVVEGMARCQGNQTLYLRLLTDFVGSYDGAASQMAQLLETNNLKAFSQFAHKFKGLTANLGVIKLPSIAAQLEKVTGIDDKMLIDQMNQFESELLGTLREMRLVLSGSIDENENETEEDMVPYSLDELDGKLENLYALISEQQMEACDEAQLLLIHWPLSQQKAQLESVIEQLDLFDFDAAASIVGSMRELF